VPHVRFNTRICPEATLCTVSMSWNRLASRRWGSEWQNGATPDSMPACCWPGDHLVPQGAVPGAHTLGWGHVSMCMRWDIPPHSLLPNTPRFPLSPLSSLEPGMARAFSCAWHVLAAVRDVCLRLFAVFHTMPLRARVRM